MPKLKSDPIDVLIGERIKYIRTLSGLSQEALGNASNITFQQVQKYEKGTNRLSVSRLLEFCTTLGCRPMDILSAAGDAWKDGSNAMFDTVVAQRSDARQKLKKIEAIVNGASA